MGILQCEDTILHWLLDREHTLFKRKTVFAIHNFWSFQFVCISFECFCTKLFLFPLLSLLLCCTPIPICAFAGCICNNPKPLPAVGHLQECLHVLIAYLCTLPLLLSFCACLRWCSILELLLQASCAPSVRLSTACSPPCVLLCAARIDAAGFVVPQRILLHPTITRLLSPRYPCNNNPDNNNNNNNRRYARVCVCAAGGGCSSLACVVSGMHVFRALRSA